MIISIYTMVHQLLDKHMEKSTINYGPYFNKQYEFQVEIFNLWLMAHDSNGMSRI